MTSSQAGFLAKQGFSMLYNATVTSVGAISTGINKAVKSYADYHETGQLESLKKSGKSPAECLSKVLERFKYLSLAGYGNEVAAAAQKIAAKLVAAEKTSVTLESAAVVSRLLVETATKYGDFSGGGWGLQDFLNSARMGKDHFDRDSLVNDFYYAILFLQDVTGGPGPEFERIVREAGKRMIEGEGFVSEVPAYGGAYNPYAYTQSSGLPSYASVPSATAPAAPDQDPKKKTAKVLFQVASAMKKASDDAEAKKIKNLRDAEETLRREKEKAAANLRPNYSNFS